MTVIFPIVAIAIIPALLWSVPKWRRRDGRWITPFKIAPLGCLTMLIVPELCWALVLLLSKLFYFKRSAWLIPVCSAVAIIAGIWVIRKASFWHQAHHKEENSPCNEKQAGFRMMSVFVLFVILGVFSLVAGTVGYYALQMKYPQRFQQPWHSCALPVSGKVKIEFAEKSIHPFMAEYDYAFIFDGELRRVHTNCGGRTVFNFYQLADGRYLWIDKDARYILDPAAHRALKLIDYKDKLYTVEVPDENITSWGGCDGTYYSFNHHKVPLFPAEGVLTGKRYLGRGTSSGFDAKAAETAIKPQWEGRYD